jgi:hypothetical protein
MAGPVSAIPRCAPLPGGPYTPFGKTGQRAPNTARRLGLFLTTKVSRESWLYQNHPKKQIHENGHFSTDALARSDQVCESLQMLRRTLTCERATTRSAKDAGANLADPWQC